MSRNKLAEAAGVSAAQLHEIMNDKRVPNVRTADRLLEAAGRDVVFKEDGKRRKPRPSAQPK